MKKHFKKRLLKAVLFLGLAIFIMSCFYHNDNFYIKLKNNNNKIKHAIGVDVLFYIDLIAHNFDLIGYIKKRNNLLEKSNFIDIKIDSSNEKKLNKYLSFSPVKKKWVQGKVFIN